MAALEINGNSYTQSHLFPAPGVTAGSIRGGALSAPTPFQVGQTLMGPALTIVDPTPATGGFLVNYPTQKSTLNLSPSQSQYQEQTGPPVISAGTNGVTSLRSYNAFNPGGPNTYIHSRHMRFFGTYPNGGPVNPSFTATSWDSPVVSWNPMGTIGATGGTGINFSGASDYRLKENISPIDNGLDYILALRPRKFQWKDSDYQTIGFIAHEIQEDVPPDLSGPVVSGEKDSKTVLVNLYSNGELLLNENGEPIVREEPIGVEAERLQLDNITWKIISEEINPQQIDTISIISPLVASVQQLKNMIDAHWTRLSVIENDISNMEKI